jgi:hypothetical protein
MAQANDQEWDEIQVADVTTNNGIFQDLSNGVFGFVRNCVIREKLGQGSFYYGLT